MTAAAIADLLRARPAGRGKWAARCPSHSDHSPSLSIAAGQDGRVMLHCFAGCSVEAILAALGLSKRDLFAEPPPLPEQAAALRAAREARERKEQAERKARREAWDRVRRWESIVNVLGAKLVRAPENEALSRVFHAACDRQHEAETKAEKWNPRRRVTAELEGAGK